MPTSPVLSLRVRHTAYLPGTARAALRALLGDDFSEDDWDHALGGLHTLAWLEGQLVGHAALVQRTLLVGDTPRRVGYLEAVGGCTRRCSGAGSAGPSCGG
ncbi:hypothetical protein [Deinococcus budaensis]|uniref:N-acetyltransferase domain-containing protein n=1 Tax=Deinococcus budaensis TaxID=1665626 RepID=A0A7W8GG65_9DEIO|nr:hypothetical protein [Deinococcus budaensis]MBB5235076.1 hypothetical protein [Deinococcus budaensis]